MKEANWTSNPEQDLSATLTWVALAHCCVSIALLSASIHLLNRLPFSRYKLGCLLIVKWNCIADLLCLLHKAGFTVLNRPDMLSTAGRHVTAWVCKLYHFSDNTTTTVQVWLLVLFATERATMSLSPRLAGKHFSPFRLRIGAAAAGAVALAGHLNYIWMFSIVSRHESRRSGDGFVGLGTLANNTTGHEEQFNQEEQLVCGILPEFHTVYAVSIILEVVVNAYAPALLFGASTFVVMFGCLRSGRQPSHQQQQQQHQQHQQQQEARRRQQQQQQQPGFESTELINASAMTLFLVLAVVCYPPLAVTSAFKARTVHLRKELSQREYILLLYILQPLKNVLSAIAYFAFVCCMLLAHKHDACRRFLPSRFKQQQQQAKDSTCSEAEIPLRPMGNTSIDVMDS